MNFSYIPELKWKYGYPVVILVSIVTVVALIWKFKRKNGYDSLFKGTQKVHKKISTHY